MGSCLGAVLFWVDGVLVPLDDVVNDAVLAETLLIGLIEGPLGIVLVFREQQIESALAVEKALSKQGMPSRNTPCILTGSKNFKAWFIFLAAPRPGIAKPEAWQHMDLGRFRPPITDRDPDQDVLRTSLGVLDEDIEVSVLIKDAGVEELILGGVLISRPVGIDKSRIGVL